MQYLSRDTYLSSVVFLFVINLVTGYNSNTTAQNTAEEIIKTALEKIPQNYSQEAQKLPFLYRETIQEDNQYAYLGEAVGTLNYGAYQQAFNVSKAQHAYQNSDHFNGNFIGNRWHNTLTHPSDKAQIFGSRQSHQWFKYNIGQAITGGPLGLTAYDKIKYPSHFFKTNKHGQVQLNEEYQFQLTDMQTYKGKIAYYIQFNPKKIHKFEAGFEGVLYVEQKSFAIMFLEYKQTSGQDVYRADKEEFTHQQHSVQLTYTQIQEKWQLAHIKVTDFIDWKDAQSSQRFAQYTTNSELWLSDTQALMNAKVSTEIFFPNTLSSTLTQIQGAYRANFWNQLARSASYPTLNSQLTNDLERHQALEAQFESVSNRLVSLGK